MSSAPRRTLTYRPALDGLRGVAVLGVLVFHLWPSAARGGWLGVDLFFVLSGYLITTILVREYASTGRVDLVRFWLARSRRLMPTLFVVLAAVLVASYAWMLPSRRGAVASDIVSTLFYVANWHFLTGDEAYFASNGAPSPLRHAWSLAIEEQYYWLFPLILLVLARFIHRRRHLALVFAALALASALWMAVLYVPGVDPTRVYYGTDTRAFELLIGAAAGAWVGPSQWGHERPQRWLLAVEKLAWPALGLIVIAMLVLDESDDALFRGGLALFCVLCLAPILAAASPHPNPFQRVFSFEWLRRLGLISYALYLWHWPVHVFLSPDRLGLGDTASGAVQAVVALVLATLTYRFVEAPVRRGGVAALLPRASRIATRGLIVAVVAALVVGAFFLPRLAGGSASTVEAGSGGKELTYPDTPYTPGAKKRVVLVGNSVPHSLLVAFPRTRFTDLDVTEATSFGCTTFPGQNYNGDSPAPVQAACPQFQATWAKGTAGADAMLYFLPQNLLFDYRIDGTRVRAGTPEHDAFITRSLDTVTAATDGQHIKKRYLVNLACHEMPVFGTNTQSEAMNDVSKVKHLNEVAARWARSKNVQVIDQYGFLCAGDTYHGTINGTPLYQDALHFTATSGPIVWNWLAPQLNGRS